jgi:hypothetical protein
MDAGVITSGEVGDARIPSGITRDTEMNSALLNKLDKPSGTTSQVVLGDGTLGSLPAGSTINADTNDPTKAAASVVSDSATYATSAGNADTVTNGVYSNLSYSDPAFLVDISMGKVTGLSTTLGLLAPLSNPEFTDSLSVSGTDGSMGIVIGENTTMPTDRSGKAGITNVGGVIYCYNKDSEPFAIGTGSGGGTDIDDTDPESTTTTYSAAKIEARLAEMQDAITASIISQLNSGLPAVAITTPSADGTWVQSATYNNLAGTSFDMQGISKIEWKLGVGGTYSETGVTGTTAWGVTGITLSEGANTVYVRATDTSSNIVEADRTINCDTVNPVISLGSDTTHDGTGASFSLTSAMITEVNYASSYYTIDGGSQVAVSSFPTSINIPADTSNHTIAVTATDLSGRTGTDSVTYTYSGGGSAGVMGYTTTASITTWDTHGANQVGGLGGNASASGTAGYVHIYADNIEASKHYNVAVYDYAGTKLAEGSLTTGISATTPTWFHFALKSAITLTSGTNYKIVFGSSDDTDFRLGSVEASGYTAYYQNSMTVADTMPASWSWTGDYSGYGYVMSLNNSSTTP